MLIINHFEGNWAVVQYNNLFFNLPKELIPEQAEVGDVLNIFLSLDTHTFTEYEEDIDTLSNDGQSKPD